MKKENIICGKNYWSIELPEFFNEEFDESNYGEYIFYPNNSDLTLRITPFHLEKNTEDGILLAPIKVLKNIFMESTLITLFKAEEKYNVDDSLLKKLSDFEKVAFARRYIDESDGKETYHICIGIFKIGAILSFNIFGTDKKECEKALKYLETLEFLEVN